MFEETLNFGSVLAEVLSRQINIYPMYTVQSLICFSSWYMHKQAHLAAHTLAHTLQERNQLWHLHRAPFFISLTLQMPPTAVVIFILP